MSILTFLLKWHKIKITKKSDDCPLDKAKAPEVLAPRLSF